MSMCYGIFFIDGLGWVTKTGPTASVSVKEIFQRDTDAWSLKFVRQRENCESR